VLAHNYVTQKHTFAGPAQRENMGEAALVKGLTGDMPPSAFIDFALFAYD
jgi:hypothetical protein